MKTILKARNACFAAMIIAGVSLSLPVHAGGGYFLLGYGPYANQSAGTSTAVGFDGFAGATNPGKLGAVRDRLDVAALAFMPNRQIQRSGSGTSYDFASTSKNRFFLLPEIGFAKRINDDFSWGVSLYGNGGLNTEYQDDNGAPGSNANPALCGNRPGNFLLGCGALGLNLSQVIVAPTLAWRATPNHSFGIAPLLGYQRISITGFQALAPLSQNPDSLDNPGNDSAFGAGVRVGWFGRITPWLDAGASWSSRIYMQEFDDYSGLLAEDGDFDIPENYSLGIAVKPTSKLNLALDIQRIRFGDIKALSNGVLNSLQDRWAAARQCKR